MKQEEQQLLYQNTSIKMEAPDATIAGLLCVLSAGILSVSGGDVLSLPVHKDGWYFLTSQGGRPIQYSGDESGMLQSPEAVILAAGGSITITARENALALVILLAGSTASQLCEKAIQEGLGHFPAGGIALKSFYSALRTNEAAEGKVSAQGASAQAYTMLMQLYQEGSRPPSDRQRMPQVVEAALAIMRRDYAYLDGVSEVAGRLEVSQEYLTRIFHKYVGMTPGRYLNDVRIANARQMLRKNQYSVAFIADACGFTNSNYFARVFRKKVGMTPKEYARTHHAGDMDASDLPGEIYVM